MPDIKLSAIVAMAQNRIIGKDNALIWHIPEDLKHFKRTTLGKPLVMGRKSYDALGKPLPGRANIVISRAHTSIPKDKPTKTHSEMESVEHQIETKSEDGPFLVSSIEDGITMAKTIAKEKNLNEIFIAGGGEIYKQTLDIIDHLYLTIIHRDYSGDTSFPEFDWKNWTITSEEKHDGNPAFTIFTLDKKR